MNDLDLEVETPDGTSYLGNVFAAGRSVTTGTRDSLNNLEVVLVDNAQVGTWTVRVKDMNHGGSRSQPYALAVSGNGVNDLRPDPMPVPDSISSNIAIPQVGDDLIISAQVQNQGNVIVNDLLVHFSVEGGLVNTATIDLGPGEMQYLYWNWQPQQAGDLTISVEVDPHDDIEEIRENNNVATAVIGVTTPGVKLESAASEVILDDPEQTTSSWEVTLTNTALLPTNASLITSDVMRLSDSQSFSSWYVGFSGNNFSLNGSDSVNITVNMVHPAPPEPGTYVIPLTGIDVDNAISYPF
ncbi:MAG: hypothetical protein NZ770_07225, partial [Candidatus Poseidoniaceae archaeon]|nr:hypothetical protein [Candidatus Poseidoniaceae archaeon]